jgi:hypothetical protein
MHAGRHGDSSLANGPTKCLERKARKPYIARMPRFSNLDDPDYARFAWRRYWRVMGWMGSVTGLAVVLTLVGLFLLHGTVSIHLYIAAALGVGFTMMLTAALMGLVFLSSGTGHDESIDDALDPDAP